MPAYIPADWQPLALYALGAAVILFVLFRLPFIGGIVRALFSIGMLAFAVFLLLQQAPYQPTLARMAERLGLGGQAVSGETVRIALSPDGHFWAQGRINGRDRRLLIDSGATVTVLSQRTAEQAGVERTAGLAPVILRTANGDVPAATARIRRLEIGGIVARDLAVVVSPAIGDIDVIGMNFLTGLKSWTVEDGTLILTPRAPTPEQADAAVHRRGSNAIPPAS